MRNTITILILQSGELSLREGGEYAQGHRANHLGSIPGSSDSRAFSLNSLVLLPICPSL